MLRGSEYGAPWLSKKGVAIEDFIRVAERGHGACHSQQCNHFIPPEETRCVGGDERQGARFMKERFPNRVYEIKGFHLTLPEWERLARTAGCSTFSGGGRPMTGSCMDVQFHVPRISSRSAYQSQLASEDGS